MSGDESYRVGEGRVRKKSKRYEGFLSGDEEYAAAKLKKAGPSTSGYKRTAAATAAAVAKRLAMKESGYSAWSRTTVKQLQRELPGASPAELNKIMQEKWNNLSDGDRLQWKEIAIREARDRYIAEASRKRKAEFGESSSYRTTLLNRPKKRKKFPGVAPLIKKPRKTPSQPKKKKKLQQPERTSGTSTLDAAAHLNLLGEALNAISERLTEHQGPIAVSGSFSVLMDALLVSIAPLLSLTQEIPAMQGAIPKPLILSMMDDTHYFLPGLNFDK